MTMRTRILILLVALCLSFALAGCNEANTHRVDLERLKDELARTEAD